MRRVLITGGGTGIGNAIACAFYENGDKVVIAGRRQNVLERTAKDRMAYKRADITIEADVEALFDTSYDIVIANAGYGASGRVASLSLQDWKATLDVNLTGTFLTFRQALRVNPTVSRLIAIASTASLKVLASLTLSPFAALSSFANFSLDSILSFRPSPKIYVIFLLYK